MSYMNNRCAIASKINETPKGVYLPISKLHSILAVANLLAHNNISQICYCGQISLQSAAVSCCLSDDLTPLGVTLILLVMVPFISQKQVFKNSGQSFSTHKEYISVAHFSIISNKMNSFAYYDFVIPL